MTKHFTNKQKDMTLINLNKGKKKEKTLILNELEDETWLKRNTIVQQIKRGKRWYDSEAIAIYKEKKDNKTWE